MTAGSSARTGSRPVRVMAPGTGWGWPPGAGGRGQDTAPAPTAGRGRRAPDAAGATMPRVRISAKADYAVRAAVELASSGDGRPVTAESLAARRRTSPASSSRPSSATCAVRGWSSASAGAAAATGSVLPAADVTVADVVRAVEGPLVSVRDARPAGPGVHRLGRPAARAVDRPAGERPVGARHRDPGRPGSGPAARRRCACWPVRRRPGRTPDLRRRRRPSGVGWRCSRGRRRRRRGCR